jgi:hypothetical protein
MEIMGYDNTLKVLIHKFLTPVNKTYQPRARLEFIYELMPCMTRKVREAVWTDMLEVLGPMEKCLIYRIIKEFGAHDFFISLPLSRETIQEYIGGFFDLHSRRWCRNWDYSEEHVLRIYEWLKEHLDPDEWLYHVEKLLICFNDPELFKRMMETDCFVNPGSVKNLLITYPENRKIFFDALKNRTLRWQNPDNLFDGIREDIEKTGGSCIDFDEPTMNILSAVRLNSSDVLIRESLRRLLNIIKRKEECPEEI